MAVQDHPTPTHAGPARPAVLTSIPGGTPVTAPGAAALAVLRIAAGAVFLWAFLDKTFGWGWSTPAARAWVHGGSPTRGYLSSTEVGPLREFFHSIAGAGWADWLFMLGLLGVGVALLLGVAVRIAAVSGIAMLALMWFAEFPPARHLATGAPSGSTNPLFDYHLVYALAIAAVALVPAATATWGLGRAWGRLPVVQRNPWLR